MQILTLHAVVLVSAVIFIPGTLQTLLYRVFLSRFLNSFLDGIQSSVEAHLSHTSHILSPLISMRVTLVLHAPFIRQRLEKSGVEKFMSGDQRAGQGAVSWQRAPETVGSVHRAAH